MEVVYGVIAVVLAFGASVFFKNRKISDLSKKLADSELANQAERREAIKKDVTNAKELAGDTRRKFDADFDAYKSGQSWRPGNDDDAA